MNLIAKLNHPYIVEYKDAWVDKVLFEFFIVDSQEIEVHHQYSLFLLFGLKKSYCCWSWVSLNMYIIGQGCFICIVTNYCEGGDM